jgi:hypothetical protein
MEKDLMVVSNLVNKGSFFIKEKMDDLITLIGENSIKH